MEPRSTRRALPHSVIVDVNVIDLKSGIQIRERTTDLNFYGCCLSAAASFPAGTRVILKMTYRLKKITAFGRVKYRRSEIRLGIVFATVDPEGEKLLEDWIPEHAISQ